MPRVQRFEDLQSWQKARQLAGCVYDLSRREGFEAGSDAEFARFLKIARPTEVKRLINGLIRYLKPAIDS